MNTSEGVKTWTRIDIYNNRTIRRLRENGFTLFREYPYMTLWRVDADPDAVLDSSCFDSVCTSPFSNCLCCCGLAIPCWLGDRLYWAMQSRSSEIAEA